MALMEAIDFATQMGLALRVRGNVDNAEIDPQLIVGLKK